MISKFVWWRGGFFFFTPGGKIPGQIAALQLKVRALISYICCFTRPLVKIQDGVDGSAAAPHATSPSCLIVA